MRIGELAERVGVSPRSLRYYEQQGLLSPSRDINGHREYDEVTLDRARNIKDLLVAGLTTEDVLLYLSAGCLEHRLTDSPRCSAELDAAQRRLMGLEDRIARLQQIRDRLVQHSADLEDAIVSQHASPAASGAVS
ncbi:MerR family transcriptional regulator [Streptomyces iconiensis]|uniref:MerR family transcriptional regulator n=1 Tax=Streptomyces iconiensis TaxID=1384038 RepID=A0ABT6ZNU6_9ACTN|nr:MerR family transcriptional regulator [Streptomyces iconiensis]MDJ1130542.1 MerR family transcriptional regulator [Streptomyces iconiensis]